MHSRFGMAMLQMWLGLSLLACSAEKATSPSVTATPPAPIDPGPTSVIITAASFVDQGSSDLVTVALQNDGGTGDFYLEFWGEVIRTSPSGCVLQPGQTSFPHPAQVTIGLSQGVNVTAG